MTRTSASRKAVASGILSWIISIPVCAQAPDGRNDSGTALARSLAQTVAGVEPLLERVAARGEILTRATKIVNSLDLPAPDPKALTEALAEMRSLEAMASQADASREMRTRIALGVDRLRTELLNASSTDMRKLADDLHHSVVHLAISESTRDQNILTELFRGMVQTQDALQSVLDAFNMDPRRERERRMIPMMRTVDPARGMFQAFDAYEQDVARLARRIRVHREISVLIHGSIRDLDTFQNAIGLNKAREKLKEAEGKFIHPDVDSELRVAVEFGLDRVETALLSPSSTDMDLLREVLHHRMAHPAVLVQLADEMEAQKHVSLVVELNQTAGRAALQLAEALGAALAREAPAWRFIRRLEPAGMR